MDNLHFLHSDNHPEDNKDNVNSTRIWDGFGYNEDFLHDITVTTPDVIYLTDLRNGNIFYINKKAEDLFGYDADYIYETGIKFLQELVHPDDRKERALTLQTAVDGTIIEAEVRLKMKDGTYHLFRMRDRVIKKGVDASIWQTLGLAIDITYHKNGVENINQIKTLFESATTGIMVLRPIKNEENNIVDFQIVHVNQIVEKFFGRKIIASSLHSDNFKNLDTNGHFDKYLEVLATRKPIVFSAHYPDQAGLNTPLSQSVVLLDNGDLAITFDDNKDFDRAKSAFKQQLKLVQGIANAIPDILFILDLNTKSIIYANKQIAKTLGYNNEQISAMKHPILDIVYEEDKNALIKHLDDMQTATDGEVREIEYRMKNVDGSLDWFLDRNTVFKRDSNGQPTEKIGIAQNITLRKNQEDKINKSLKILQQSEELAQIGSWDYDIRTKKFSWSDGMYTLFDIVKDVPVSPSIYLDYVLEQDRPLAETIVKAIENTFEPFIKILRIKLDGEVKTIKIKSVPYKDGYGNKASIVGVDMDISASILTEIQIKELNHTLQIKNRGLESANTDLKAFNTLAATNYRQTLQKLYTSMEYLITNDARNLSNEGRANIRRAQSSIQKMKLMTEDMINLSKLHTLGTQLVDVDLNSTLAEVITSMNDKIVEAKAVINYAEMPAILGYPTLISLLFHHLLDNTIKFHRQDVQVIVDIAYKTDNINNVAYHVISIADNGIGFEQENAQEVFTMFYRNSDASYKGSGIGLAVCKKIMDIHDGFITANSIVDKETTFSCYFPITSTLNK